jgi:cytochrome c551/c552
MILKRILSLVFGSAVFVLLASSAPAAGSKTLGKALVDSAGCKGCHRIHGSGGTMGPALDGVGRRLSRKRLRQKLVRPGAGKKGGSLMPSYAHLTETDLNSLIDYLESLKK